MSLDSKKETSINEKTALLDILDTLAQDEYFIIAKISIQKSYIVILVNC